ncbi:hypothetical protein ACFORO_39535 [Amycolatopsis halotolerans]|uniref:Uncharacterized protein n=1 Tax=Amycolatopsis halotolerans TaxID=330083 RepID=A0ABV7QVJ3_9PSEU
MPRFAKPRLSPRPIAAAVVFVVFATALVIHLTTRSDDDPAAEPATSSPVSATTSSSPPSSTAPSAPLDPAGYQKLLTAIGASITPAVQQLEQATTPAEVNNASSSLGSAVSSAIQQLDSALPPDAIRSTNRALLSDFTVLYNSSVPKIGSSALTNKLCGGVSAVAELSNDQGIAGLRDTLAKLATADPAHPYHLDPLFPDAHPEPNRSAENGAVLAGAGGGKNSVSIKNVSGTDQAVTFADLSHPVFTVYVKAGATTSASGIADGHYTVYSTGGTDWDASRGRFTRDCSFSKFGVPAAMKDNGYTHTNIDLTVRKIDPRALPSGPFPEQSSIEPLEYPH